MVRREKDYLAAIYSAIAVLIFLANTNLLAQSPTTTIQSDTLKQLKVDEVQVTGKTSIRKTKEQAFNINVVDAKQLYNSSVDLNQILNRTSGVRIREDGGMGSTFSFSLNGFSGRQVKFFLDGLPMDNFGSSLTLNNFPATMAERIEIYKGVLPVHLGADALGGAVNIVTRTNANFLDVSYGYGSFNTHKASINGAFTDAKTGFTVRTNAFYNYSDNNYKVTVNPIDLVSGQKGPEQEVERFHDTYKSIAAQVEVGVTGRSYADHLLFGAMVAGNNKDIQTGITMEQVFGARTTTSSSIIPTLKYKKSDLFLDGLDLTLFSAYNISNNNFVDTTRLRYNWLGETAPTTTAELSRTQLKNRDKEALTSANLTYSLNNSHAVSLNYTLTDFQRKSSDEENPDNITFLMPQGLRKQTIGLSWQATYKRFTSTVFGKLYDLHAESFEDVSTNTVADYVPTTLNRTHAGYGAATAYFITPQLQAKASYEHTYRMPEAVELLGDGLFVRRNANLKPEKSDNLNIGALYSIIPTGPHRLNFEGSFIFRNAKDYIRQDQQQVQPIDRQFINVGNVRTTGAEAELSYVWNNKLFASVNATFQDIIDRTEFLVSENLTGTTTSPNLNYGYRLPNMPYLFGNANIGTRLHPTPNDKNTLSLNYGLSYVEKYYFTPNQIGQNNHDIIPRQISHDLFADYSINDGKYVIALECKNIMNEKLYDNYLLQKPGRSFFIKLRYFITQ
ncbi:TonB-dependent receptor [Sphingobacterium shayense]|uniref:TonB-dependent receptor plug domain-containing protein n=1 Tax=Sphingobacterium shayense TaxID=626343 RepID=UPI0015567D1B|nr:TonB-dependent receptor [Sphingobacterium shayense]NQD69636.1 TonB-dependent receptor [Sphingobacterium shayense]